ncbi:MarR family winged helix-turn-helix transcriptional regulator [Actinomadura parmotrematis]|uniref:MarR family transcriptional regulator n=1 Tax=Actinomadura parmotrematis TaxID=2864039 RepID=A0ABS7FUV3_9ACTN|nr:MarR family transcriptional regulator [Actinomadura parmotrematis]MBW8484187.1 MarR family transcriptional regulator [Actinomadura parmotrematis]
MARTSGGRTAHEALERELGVFLRRARAASDRLSRAVHPELDSAAYGLLAYLREHGPARPSDLAGYVGVGKATITRQMNVLEGLGLVERHADPADGRARRLALTEEGRSRLNAVSTARREHFHARLESWPEEDVRTLATLLARLNGLGSD